MRAIITRLFGRAEPVFAAAGARDVRAIAHLHAASFRRGWSESEIEHLLSARDVLAHRAAVRGNLAGFILSRRAADEAEILSVAVASAQRGRGIAARLLRLHVGRLAALGTAAVFLEVEEDNEPARRLYRSFGFRQVGRREGYYASSAPTGAAALVLRRDLR